MVYCFRLKKKKTFVLSNPSWYFVLFCRVFYCYFDFRKPHFPKDDNEKKSHGRRNERHAENFPRNENIKLQLACEQALYFGRVARSHARAARVRRHEFEGRGERRVLSRLASLAINGELASRLNFNSCLARYSFS